MSRRTVLQGTSEREREIKLYQQRDYAAQLQEQVRLKNERAVADKTRRMHEEKIERDAMDKERTEVEAIKSNQRQLPASSPIRSPQRKNQSAELEIHHTTTAVVSGSPNKHTPLAYGGLSLGDVSHAEHRSSTMVTQLQSIPSSSSSYAAVVPPFASGPSIFDALMQGDSTSMGNKASFNEDMEALRSLRSEIEMNWKQRRTAAQTIYEKPSFLITIQPPATSNIALTREEKRQLDDDVDLETHSSNFDEVGSSMSGLIGESVLIPVPVQEATNSPRNTTTRTLLHPLSSPTLDYKSDSVLHESIMQFHPC